MKIKTILVPTDFSDDAEVAVNTAVELAKAFDAKIELLHAYHLAFPLAPAPLTGPIALPDDFYAQLRIDAENRVKEAVKRLEDAGVAADGRAVSDPAVNAILDAAEALDADLIVMGTRGLTGLKHVVLGSVAERTLRLAPCPVLTVKAS